MGGYFILHDYYGWYDAAGNNGSPIKKAIDLDLKGFEQVQIDTGFASFVVFRKTTDMLPRVSRAPKRADGRPTVGLVIIAKGDEGATIIARAIVSAWKMVDAVTVITDGGPQTAEVCRHLGADVYVRPTPKVDWDRGVGFIAGARNEALAIAEPKTDYVLILDPDDVYTGEIPTTLTADAYEVVIHDGGLRYTRVQMFKSGKGYHYEGIRHEALTFQGTLARLPDLIYHRGHGGHQDLDPPAIKYSKHAKDFERWLVDHPDDSRAQFYLGQSYRDAGQGDKPSRPTKCASPTRGAGMRSATTPPSRSRASSESAVTIPRWRSCAPTRSARRAPNRSASWPTGCATTSRSATRSP